VRVLWQGAEYRGRGRETLWQGKLSIARNRIVRFAPVNFLNPERKIVETAPGTLSWSSVTTGNLAGIDLWLDARNGVLSIESNIVSGAVDLAALTDDKVTFEAGGLGRRLSVYRLPERDWSRRIAIDPGISFGRPVVVRLGISTAVLAERLDAGESIEDLAADYGLSLPEIEQAVLYERTA